MRDYKSSVVILTHNKWKLTEQLLADLHTHEKDNIDEVLVVDNGSAEGYVLNNPFSALRYERLEQNIGFTLGFNYGLKLVTGKMAEKKIVFAISNDVRVHGKFVEQAAEILLDVRRHLVGNRHIAFDSGWNTFDGKIFDYLEGWFLAATSDGWRDLDYFDPNYAPYDYEDVDLSTVAKAKGYKLVSLNNPNIVHLGAGTIGFNPKREAITLRNKEYFRKKWMP